jgi:ubiquinone/menaquinone biosynthesis C-methylase UbiE
MSEVKENKGYVSAEYLKKVAKDAKEIKTRSYQLLQIQADSQVLDVGCGPAIDTIVLSEYIDERGRIVGVDNDPAMIEKANLEVKKRNITKRVQHVEGNANSLPFADEEFDRIHAERLFQVLPKLSADSVFSEMNRVLKKDGIIVIADADWGTASVNFSDNELERRLLAFFTTRLRPNGFAGRQLFEFLKNGGYSDIRIEIIPFVTRDFSETPFCEWLPIEALKNGVAIQKEIALWKAELTEKTTQGTYLSYVNMVVVCGTKK